MTEILAGKEVGGGDQTVIHCWAVLPYRGVRRWTMAHR
jgi:hypothetical protein